jgi:2'-5' RNA ligase
MRAFIAAPLPELVRSSAARIAEVARAVLPGARCRWTPPETYHLTLAFLGEIDDAAAARLGDALAEALAGMPAVPIRVAGAGGFPAPEVARVLWAGLDGGDALANLAARIRGAVRAAGLMLPDDRPFAPHVTLARCFRPCDARHIALFASRGDTGEERCLLDRVVLFRSRLRPEGAEHEPLRAFRLGGGGA